MRQHFSLEPGITFLNHGSFGATPKVVQARQRAFQDQLEAEPVRFMTRELEPLLNQSREVLSTFLKARTDDLVFVKNATTGVNTVLRSLQFNSGDELLTTSHAYNACANALKFVAERSGARVVIADIPFPIEAAQQITDAVMKCVTPRTKLALIDHITSPTALIFPVEALVSQLEARGVMTLIDGAHAPGVLPLSLTALGASFYTANLHKAACAPKGSAFLHVRADRQHLIRPLMISHGANAGRTDKSFFHSEFDWVGTDDFSAWLSVPEAITFMGSLFAGGWDFIRAYNHQLVVEARALILTALGSQAPCPDELLGTMASIILPGAPNPNGSLPGANAADPLKDLLFDSKHIEVPIFRLGNTRIVRITGQIYNSLSEYQLLADALREHFPNAGH